MTIPARIPKKYRDRIQFWDDERDVDHGYIITLHYGWTVDPIGHQGVFGEDTLKDVLYQLSMSRPCDCPTCQANMNKC